MNDLKIGLILMATVIVLCTGMILLTKNGNNQAEECIESGGFPIFAGQYGMFQTCVPKENLPVSP